MIIFILDRIVVSTLNILQNVYFKSQTFTSSASDNNKEKTVNINNSSDVEMKNNDQNNNKVITFEELNNIKITKSRIFNEQRTKLKN